MANDFAEHLLQKLKMLMLVAKVDLRFESVNKQTGTGVYNLVDTQCSGLPEKKPRRRCSRSNVRHTSATMCGKSILHSGWTRAHGHLRTHAAATHRPALLHGVDRFEG